MVELVTSSSGSNEQTLFSQACKIFRLELPGEVVSCEFARAQAGKLMYEFEFLPAEMGHIGAEFLAAQLIEYVGPKWFELLRLNVACRSGQVLTDESKEIRVSECLFVKPGSDHRHHVRREMED